MSISVLEENVNDNEIMNVIKVFSETLGRNAWIDIAKDDVASGAIVDVIGDVSWEDELTFIPLDQNLRNVSKRIFRHDPLQNNTLSCHGCRYRGAWRG
jgi:hypothetical protein